ncbi:PIN domain-containing protein [Dactylosporangium sp. NPDC048998]|uniref:PIN domain-containing protein n=1 Tax=Dactylosporangium sp. NPDC048998 TaxID=3363976 RepID=UPI0037148E8B
MFTAVLDTCVLWPSLQRDFLLSLAVEGMYRPVWSAAILEELEYHEAMKLVSRGEEEGTASRRANRLVQQMRAAFDDAEVHGWEGLDGSYGLPDPDDEHVLAAAVVAGAGAIVTHNLKHFPSDRLPLGVEVLPPSEFAANTVSLDPVRARAAVSAIAERSGKQGPPLTEHQVLDALVSRYGMTQVAQLLRDICSEA